MKKLFLLLAVITATQAQPAFAQHGYVHDAVREKEYNEHGASGEDKLNSWLGNLTDVKVAHSYVFPVYMKMHTKSYGRNGKVKDELEMDVYVNAAKSTTGIRMYEEKHGEMRPMMFTIYDYKHNNSLLFDLKKNTYMAFNLNAFMSKENQQRRETGNAKVNEHISCNKTGRKKTIQGYSCYEFVCNDERLGERHEYWIATQLPYTMSDALSRTLKQRNTGNTAGMNGAILEEHDYKGEDLIREMMVLELNPHESYTFDTRDYKYNGIGEIHFYD